MRTTEEFIHSTRYRVEWSEMIANIYLWIAAEEEDLQYLVVGVGELDIEADHDI